MSLNSQVVLFAIQAAVRLEGQVRQSQLDSIKNQSFNLLSPKFVAKISVESAVRWLTRDGAHTIANDEALIKLVSRAEFVDEDNPLTKAEQQKLVNEYIKRKNLSEGHFKFDNDGGLSADNLYALTDVKQWENNPNPSPLQRVCGSLIDIGVDYFKNYSNAINPNSPKGKVLMSFLDAVDEVDFAEGNMNDIASRMMIATLDTLDAGTDLLSDDKNANLLLKSIAKGVISDVSSFVNGSSGNLLKQEQAKQWGQVIFKSVLNTAGETVLDNPTKFLGTANSGASEMVTGVGNCLLSSIMEDVDTGAGVRVSLKNVFTKDTLDKVTKASFQVLAEHPEWYEVDNEGVKNILNALVKELANYPNQLGMDMLPDLATMILSQTAGNLQVIYQGDPSNPANNLLIKATTIVINTLQNAIPQEAGQPWQPIFTKSNMLTLVDGVLQEVVSKPDWILSKAGSESPILEDVLASVFKSLQGVSMGSMSTETKMNIVRSAISAVTMRQDLLAKANINGKEQQLLNVGIDIVLDLAFKQTENAKAKWALASSQAIDMMVNAVLIRVAKEGGSADVINLTKDFIYGEINALTNGQPFDIKTVTEKLKSGATLQELLQNSINAATRISATILAEHPELIKIENEGVKNIVNHLIQVLAGFPSDINAAILPDLAMMIVTDTSSNLEVMASGAPDSPAKNLLIVATQTVLNQLATKDANGKVTFGYSSQQAMDLIDTVLQSVVTNPNWVLNAAGEASPMLEDALGAAMKSLSGVSIQGMSNNTKIGILKSAISAVALRQDLLAKANIDGQEKDLLSGSIDIALDLAFGEKANAKAKWLLMSGDVMDELVNGVLYRVAKEGASSDVLALTKEFLNGEVEALTGGGSFDIQDIITKLKSGDTLNALMMNSINAATRITATLLSENSDRIKIENQGVKNIVNHLLEVVANYPNDFGISILPDLATMILLDTSDNLDTMVGNDGTDPSKNLLVLAGQTVLNQLAAKDANGNVTFSYSSQQALDLIDTVLQAVVVNPNWILTAVGETSPMLEDALAAAMHSINGVSIQGMSNNTKIGILKSSISAVALRQDLLVKANIDGQEKDLLSGSIDIALDLAFGEKANAKAKWLLMSGDVMDELVNGVLYRVAKEGASSDVLALTKEFLNGEIEALTGGGAFDIQDVITKLKSGDTLNELMMNSINAATRITATLLSENSDRIKIENQGVKNIVNHLFEMVANYPNDFGISILPDLATMILLDTSDNLDTMVGNDGTDPSKNLLVLAGQTTLNCLCEKDSNGKIKMKFTTDQVLDLVDTVFQQVVSKPQWVTAAAGQADPFLGIAMGAVMTSIKGADVLKMSNDAKINILKTALTAVATDKGFMNKVGVDNQFVMTTAVNLVFKTAQGEVTLPSGSTGSDELTNLLTDAAKDSIKWALSDNDTLEDITGAVLRRVASEGTSEQTLEMTNTLLAHEVMRIAKGEPFSVADLVNTLDSPEKLADLIANFVNN